MGAPATTPIAGSRTRRPPRNAQPVAVPVPEPVAAPAGPGLTEALLAVAAAAPKLSRDATGQIGPRQYRYATLDSVLDDVGPLLLENGLVWRAQPTIGPDGGPALRYRMTHAPSGEEDEDTMALMCATNDPQGQGSALTYARRYALVAYLNLAPGEDDDGAAASGNGRAPGPQAQARPAAQPVAEPPGAGERPATARQRAMLNARARDAALSPGAYANIILSAAGETGRAWEDEAAAQRWLSRALERLPAAHVNGVLERIGHVAAATRAPAGAS